MNQQLFQDSTGFLTTPPLNFSSVSTLSSSPVSSQESHFLQPQQQLNPAYSASPTSPLCSSISSSGSARLSHSLDFLETPWTNLDSATSIVTTDTNPGFYQTVHAYQPDRHPPLCRVFSAQHQQNVSSTPVSPAERRRPSLPTRVLGFIRKREKRPSSCIQTSVPENSPSASSKQSNLGTNSIPRPGSNFVNHQRAWSSGAVERPTNFDCPPPLPPRNKSGMSLGTLILSVEKDLQSLTAKTKDCDGLWQQLKELQSHFVIKLTEIQQLKAVHTKQLQVNNGQMPNQQNLDNIKNMLENSNRMAGQLYQSLVDTRKAILVTLNDCADYVGRVRNELVNKVLLEWKRGQKLAQIGFPFDRQDELLDKIATLFEQLAEEAWSLRTYAVWIKDLLQQAPNLPDNNVQQCLTVLQPMGAAITRELESLVRESFIVSKQPNVVLKQHNKFTAETRLLVGDKLGFKFLNLKVGVKLISEEHARALKDGGIAVQQASTVAKIGFGPISNSSGESQDVNLEVERESKRVRACFKSRLLKVDPRKSGGKNNDEAQQVLVCERNYALLFTCSPFQLSDISFPCVWTLSLPVKLTVHGSQERLSQAMILWDHAFAPPEAPFNVPEAVEWHLLAEALKSKFLVQTGATRGLSKSDLEYLVEKCTGNAVLASSTNVSKQLISLQRFSKDPMREGVDFSFWHWFFDIMALIKQKLLRFWDDGFVKGFIGRSEASDLLLNQAQPSFLLRFSDSHVGGLSISFAVQSEDGRKEIFPLSPFTVKDLDHLSLAQRIAGCPQLQQVETVVGADGLLFEKSAIFRKEAEMTLRQRPSGPFDKDGHPYILSDLVMIARINGRTGTDSTPLSPFAQGGCWSPNAESAQAILEGADGVSEGWEGIDINNIDWQGMGIPCAPQQPMVLTSGDVVDVAGSVCKKSPPSTSRCMMSGDAIAGHSDHLDMDDLVNLITGDGPLDPYFQRQIVGEHRQPVDSKSNVASSDDKMDEDGLAAGAHHGEASFDWMPPNH